ncbi:putative Ubiquitin conjugating enzyme [Trypanosoma vivax]|uniref:Putative ubiquitin-conjugating enzyme e2 n=1 Tax=Trypanosoma vivax (strain Y486) TaxID=1055687 RepID=G0TY58_TRYVY|nr:putative ubiquitin-conjugating enzyme e2 [Trypanosoma vivax]KAH8618625.1 putative Ubiquitin conjugating enzyme [Trypanosoma vivax]CCC48903.1 putative ubiquitin-conjugating enzyme e2 [Trypanosoma vivax Y486]
MEQPTDENVAAAEEQAGQEGTHQSIMSALAQHASTSGENPRNDADARRRLTHDLIQLQRSPCEQFSARPIDGDLYRWRAVVAGPEATPWEGGLFKLLFEFTSEYPYAPPVVRFVTKVFHPNVYVDGKICLDTLKTNWSPSLNVESLLLMIISLLSDPNPNSAANGEAAALYTQSRDQYDERVQQIVLSSLEQEFSDEDESADT